MCVCVCVQCDRIQWIGDEIEQLSYTRCDTLKISDHKPVSGLFEIGAKEVIRDRKRIVYESLIRQLDSWENQAIPKVTTQASEQQRQRSGMCESPVRS